MRALVSGPSQPRYSRHEHSEHAMLDIEVDFMCNEDAKALRQRLIEVLAPSLALNAFPRMLIIIKLIILCDDGNLFSTAVNGCALALLDAALPMHYYPIASIAIARDCAGTPSLIIDPTASEYTPAMHTVQSVYRSTDMACVYSEMSGTSSAVQLTAAEAMNRSYAQMVSQHMQQAISSKIAAIPHA